MAATISALDFQVQGDKRVTTGTVTADTSYPTGGYSIAPNQVGLATVLRFDVDLPVDSTPAIRAARYNYSTNKLMFFDQAFAEIANGVDLSTFSTRFEALGW